MPYVEGGHNDKIFPWKGSAETTSDKYKDKELKYPFGNQRNTKLVSTLIVLCSGSCSS